MYYLIRILPMLSFILIFVGSGLCCTFLGIQNAFYQLSPITAIIPAIALGWFLHKGTTAQRMADFLDGVRHPNIITMCLIYLLAGAFSEVTKCIGSVDSTVNFAMSLIPSHFLLVSLFIISAFVATSIGTSMGTIATIAPIALGLSTQADLPIALSIGTVIGGATFGDNLSLISDTTIAAVTSQQANMKQKLKINAQVAVIASFATILILLFMTNTHTSLPTKEYSLLLITPYAVLMTLALSGVNVFISLVTSTAFAGIVGWIAHGHSLFTFSQSLNAGFLHMNEIMILSFLVGGLSALSGKDLTQKIADNLSSWIDRKNSGFKTAQLLIAKLVSLFDILLANNTIAIILSGEIAREIARRNKVPAAYSAAWLDIFSCVFQGLIPYGAQILLASTIAGISPLAVVPYVFYCYILAVVAVLYILLMRQPQLDQRQQRS
ncbi:MAG: Na+/H+ antiporter NhaC family protein [Holosporaceae bacterium]